MAFHYGIHCRAGGFRHVNKNNQGRHLLSCGSSFFMHAPYSTRPNPSARALRVQVAEGYQHGRTVCLPGERKSVGEGKSVSVSVDLGGRGIYQKKKKR